MEEVNGIEGAIDLDKAKKAKNPSSELLRSLQWIIRTIGFLIVPIGLLTLVMLKPYTFVYNYKKNALFVAVTKKNRIFAKRYV